MSGNKRLYISFDLEGVAGISHWDQIMPTGKAYTTGQRLVTGELNAVCMAAQEAGFKVITVNDSHGHMRNLEPDQLVDGVHLISGHVKPMYMMEGLDESFEAVIFLGYHGPAGSASILSHTYSPQIVWEARINGEVTGETGLNSLVAHHYRVPVVLVSGDEHTVADARKWIPEATGVTVKWSRSRFAAESMGIAEAHAMLSEGTRLALKDLPKPPDTGPTVIDLVFLTEDMAIIAERSSGVERTGQRSVQIASVDGLSAFKTFVTVLYLARNVVDA